MNRLLLVALGLTCAGLLTATPAAAQIVFTLDNVSLGVPVGGTTFAAGSLTGSFTTSSSTITKTTTLLTWNIAAPSTGAINGHAFTGFTYNPTDSTAVFNVGSNGLLTGFELDAPAGSTTGTAADAVRFYFTTPLSASGTVALSTPANPPALYENEQASGGNRVVESGSVAAVPEPSAWTLGFVAALLFSALVLRTRQTRA